MGTNWRSCRQRYKGTNKPDGVWPEVWQGTSHKESNKLIKEVKEFREQYENNTLTEAPLEGIRPAGISTGEGAWPGAPAVQYSAPATAQKEITRHIVGSALRKTLRSAMRDIQKKDVPS